MQVANYKRFRKGRNEKLIANRNKLLVARFYYYSTLNSLKFSVCLELLEKEFFISQSRIEDLISQNADYISILEDENCNVNILRTYFPFFSWHYNHGKKSQTGSQLFLDLS